MLARLTCEIRYRFCLMMASLTCFVFGHAWVHRLRLEPETGEMVPYRKCRRCNREVVDA